MLDSETYFLPDFLGSHKELSSIGNEKEMTQLQFESVIKCFSFQKGELQSLFIKKFINLEKPCLSYSPDSAVKAFGKDCIWNGTLTRLKNNGQQRHFTTGLCTYTHNNH